MVSQRGKRYYFFLAICILYFVFCRYAYANKVGTTGAQFLKIGVGARPIGMGGCFAGIADDVNAIEWNPAGLNYLSEREISFTHGVWLEDIYFDYLAYASLNKVLGGRVGGAVKYLSMSKIEKIDNLGFKSGESFQPYDLAIIVSYAREIINIPLGINFKFIRSEIDDSTANTFAFDLGGIYKLMKEKLSIGVVVENIGAGMKFDEKEDPLPLNMKIGGAYQLLKDSLTVAMEFNIPSDNNINQHLGVEYIYKKIKKIQIVGRTGYKTNTIEDIDLLSGLSLGLGFKLQGYSLDYAWVPYGELEDTHRISLSARF